VLELVDGYHVLGLCLFACSRLHGRVRTERMHAGLCGGSVSVAVSSSSRGARVAIVAQTGINSSSCARLCEQCLEFPVWL
jgi:hypothetical protein